MSQRRKTESSIRPPLYDVSISGDEAIIRFAANVTEKVIEETDQEEQQMVYEYDSYTLTVKNRPDLENDISTNYNCWFEKAKQVEYDELAAEIRAKRDELLAETDKEFTLDRVDFSFPDKITTSTLLKSVTDILDGLKGICNSEMAKYRQALRDIPQQDGFPYDVKFPVKPNNQ